MVFSSNGKLLLTAEYVVLDGAKALALPTTYNQQLEITETKTSKIIWQSFDENKHVWYTDEIKISDILKTDYSSENEITLRLIQIFKAIHILNPIFFKSTEGFNIKTYQNFNRKWGLGTSSTLINNIATWAKIDAYKLLEMTFGGSGYDIACAQNDFAITYQLSDKVPQVESVLFNPRFKDNIYFVYLNQKQNSRDGILNYRKQKHNLKTSISEINAITQAMITSNNLSEFENLVFNHEKIISKVINKKPIKELLFSDYTGNVKSLGAWGGDFVMVTSEQNPEEYFRAKGFNTIIPYARMIKINN